MRIQTVTSLSLTDHWAGVKTHDVAMMQGELDGACGPYALMNALMLSGLLTERQVRKLWDLPADGRTILGKWSRATDALIASGCEVEDLKELLRGVQRQVDKIKALEVVPIELSGRTEGKLLGGLSAVQEWIDRNDQPVLVVLQWNKRDAHWAVVVGSQYHKRGDKELLSNLLVVDSSQVSSRVQAWNAVLGLGPINAKRLHYTVPSDDESIPCDLIEAFGIVKP
jgi:hypothetical protein